MKKDMQAITLNQDSNSQMEALISFLEEIITKFKGTKNSIQLAIDDIKYCYQLRKNRKLFNAFLQKRLAKFESLGESKQVEIELYLYNSCKTLDKLIPEAIAEIRKSPITPLGFFLIRELNIMQSLFNRAQKEMASHLYCDNSNEILSNPQLYNEIVDAWGDLAHD